MCFFARLVPTESHCRCIATASARCLLLNVRQQPGQLPGGNSPHYTSQTVAVEEVVDKSEERITWWRFDKISDFSVSTVSIRHPACTCSCRNDRTSSPRQDDLHIDLFGKYLVVTSDIASLCASICALWSSEPCGGLGVHICGQLLRCRRSSDARATFWASAKIKLPPRAGCGCQWQRGRWFRKCLPWFATWNGRALQVRMIGQV